MYERASRAREFSRASFSFYDEYICKTVFLLSMAEHMITTEKAKPGCDDNDCILLYQHTDYNSYPNAKNHQSQKSSHIPNLVLWSYNILCRKSLWNTESKKLHCICHAIEPFHTFTQYIRSQSHFLCCHPCQIQKQSGPQSPEPYRGLWSARPDS